LTLYGESAQRSSNRWVGRVAERTAVAVIDTNTIVVKELSKAAIRVVRHYLSRLTTHDS
jgi:hypothetical protein